MKLWIVIFNSITQQIMNRATILGGIFAICLVTTFITFGFYQVYNIQEQEQMKKSKPIQWEYQVVSYKDESKTITLEEYLNAEGSFGWELIKLKVRTFNHMDKRYFIVFKRKVKKQGHRE